MDKKKAIKYWLKSSKNDWQVAGHLFENKDYSYALFFGHLTIEKIIKALYVDRIENIPPFTHNLKQLAQKISLNLTDG